MGGHMAPSARHGPYRGAHHLWILGQDTTWSQAPLGLFPGPWNCLGGTIPGCNHPGPQGESEIHREEMHQCGFLSAEVLQPVNQTTQ